MRKKTNKKGPLNIDLKYRLRYLPYPIACRRRESKILHRPHLYCQQASQPVITCNIHDDDTWLRSLLSQLPNLIFHDSTYISRLASLTHWRSIYHKKPQEAKVPEIVTWPSIIINKHPFDLFTPDQTSLTPFLIGLDASKSIKSRRVRMQLRLWYHHFSSLIKTIKRENGWMENKFLQSTPTTTTTTKTQLDAPRFAYLYFTKSSNLSEKQLKWDQDEVSKIRAHWLWLHYQ